MSDQKLDLDHDLSDGVNLAAFFKEKYNEWHVSIGGDKGALRLPLFPDGVLAGFYKDMDYDFREAVAERLAACWNAFDGMPRSEIEALLTPTIPDGVPCARPGCLSHVSHPCEGCGRINGRSVLGVKGLLERLASVEARAARLERALKTISDSCCPGAGGFKIDGGWRSVVLQMQAFALASLRGKGAPE